MVYLYHIPEPGKKLYFKSDTCGCLVCTPIAYKAKKFSHRDFALVRQGNLKFYYGLDFQLEEV